MATLSSPSLPQLNFRQRLVRRSRDSQALAQFAGTRSVGHGNKLRAVPRDLAGEFVEILAGGQRHHAKALRQRFHDVKGLAPDRAGRTEDGDGFHAMDESSSGRA